MSRVSLEESPTAVIRIEGDLDFHTAESLRNGFSMIDSAQLIVVDLQGVPFMDSAGLGSLVGGIRQVREAGGTAVVCCPQKNVRRLFTVTGLDRIVPVTSTIQEAEELIATLQPRLQAGSKAPSGTGSRRRRKVAFGGRAGGHSDDAGGGE